MTVGKLKNAIKRRILKYLYYPLVSLFRDSKWKIQGVRVERIGSRYGGGWLALDLLNDRSIVYSFGVGCDITFDEMLIRRTGSQVLGFDPTPRSREWIKNNPNIPPQFTFAPVGLAETTGTKKLFLPANKEFVSGSIVKELGGGFIECDFLSLPDIMERHEHKFIDLIKMDIEGAEYAIVESWLRRDYIPPVRQLWIEFHPDLANHTTRSTMELVMNLNRLHFAVAKRAFVQNPNHYLLVNTLGMAG